MTLRAAGILLAVCIPMSCAAQQGTPLSAIDWLEQALTQPQGPSAPARDTATSQPETFAGPAATDATPIVALPLEQTTLDSTGLFGAARIDLPRDLWGQSALPLLTEGIAALDPDMVPAAQRLLLRMLTAEFAPPLLTNDAAAGSLLTARLDKLIEIGALEQASQLIEAAPARTVALNTRAFDIALLLGEEDRACTRLQGQLASANGEAARVFCMARRGNWHAAHAALGAARALEALGSTEASLLTRFLEEEEADFTLPPPQRLTPMGWRILEALGDPVGTGSLPVAFAHADLRGTSGWRAKIDAAETLTRMGVMQPERLMGIYSQRHAAASGGIWDRVRAIHALDDALEADDTSAIAAALQKAWALFEAVGLENALSRIFAGRLADRNLSDTAQRLQWAILLLAEERLDRAAAITPETETGALALALASGSALPKDMVDGYGPAILAAFDTQSLPMPQSVWLAEQEHGRLLLDGLALIADATQGDLLATERGLATLLALGLQRDARQIALELLLLERRG